MQSFQESRSITFEVFQLVKLEGIQISSKKVEFEILLTQPHTRLNPKRTWQIRQP